MKIKIWGTRGSLPSPGADMLKYGGNTTCLEIMLNDGYLLIVDAGSGMRLLGKKITQENRFNEIYLYLTHAHWDHLMGFPFFIPAYNPKCKIHVRGGPLAKRYLKNYLSHQLDPPFFPVDFKLLKAEFDFSQGDPVKIRIGPAEVFPVPLCHPNGGYGFKLVENGKSFVFLTDNELDFKYGKGLSTAEYIEICRDADLLIHDSQYTDAEYEHKRGWGHSTFLQAANLGMSARVKRLGFCHHDPDRIDDDLDSYAAECKQRIKSEGFDIENFGVREGMEIEI